MTFSESNLIWAILFPWKCCSWWTATAAASSPQLGLCPSAMAFLIFSRHSLETLFCPKITRFMVRGKKFWAASSGIYTPLRWIKPTWSPSALWRCYWHSASSAPLILVLSLHPLFSVASSSHGVTRGDRLTRGAAGAWLFGNYLTAQTPLNAKSFQKGLKPVCKALCHSWAFPSSVSIMPSAKLYVVQLET